MPHPALTRNDDLMISKIAKRVASRWMAAAEPLPGQIDPFQAIADVHEDSSEQLKNLALKNLSDIESVKRQAMASLEKELKDADWRIDNDVDGASAWTKMHILVDGVDIPITITVVNEGEAKIELGIPYGGKWNTAVEGAFYPEGFSEADFDQFGKAYLQQYQDFDWEPVFEWLAANSSAAAAGGNFFYDHKNEEKSYDYYDLKARG